METLWIEGVRCFRDRQRIPIRPVTLLVGENSAGKSTVLAMVRAAWDVENLAEPDFNEEPFSLGSYNTIAHYHGGQGRRVQHFVIKSRRLGRKTSWVREVTGTFEEQAGQPSLTKWEVADGDDSVVVEWREGSKDRAAVRATLRGTKLVEADDFEIPRRQLSVSSLMYRVERYFAQRAGKDLDGTVSLLNSFNRLFGGRMRAATPRPIATAPIRSRPERTYDPRRDVREPGGSHVPMRLATLYVSDRERFQTVTESIANYGSAAGLFSKLEVKQLGKLGDPFQVAVTVDKHPFNLTDVGYGVSQILPILFDTVAMEERQTFLLQQPEVHLHPRAQAALGTLLVTQAANRGHTFVVETHSDYVVDRVRMDVRTKRGPKPLDHKDVAILYFERKAGRATVHPVYLDENGNLVDVPTGYRQFFLEEERRLLGID